MEPHLSRGRGGAFCVGPRRGKEPGDGRHARHSPRGVPAEERTALPSRIAHPGRAASADRADDEAVAQEEGELAVMKVEAVVVRDRVETVMEAVEEQTGHVGVTVVEAVGHGREKGITHEYRGRVFESRFLPKAHLTFVVRDEIAEDVIAAIVDAAKTGHVNGDGICWMSQITGVTHNRTGQRLEEVERV
jgi:nitrogen regulatory protein P-II 1